MNPVTVLPKTFSSAVRSVQGGCGEGRTSQKVAIRAACFNVRDREETDVENEFATSLAPMLKASIKAKITPSAKMYVYCGRAGIRSNTNYPFSGTCNPRRNTIITDNANANISVL